MKTSTGISILIILVFAVASTGSMAQNFQGTLTYTQDIMLSKSFIDMGITKEMLKKEMAKDGSWFDTVRTSYRPGEYYSVTNSKSKLYKIYSQKVNKIYNFNTSKDENICGVVDAVDLDLSGKPDKPQVIQVDTTVTINGLSCKLIRVKWKLSAIDYYYSSSYAVVDLESFAKHTYEGFADFLKASKGALPVQMVKGAMGITIIQTLASSKEEKVNPNLFKIPELVDDESLNIMKMPGMVLMRVKQ